MARTTEDSEELLEKKVDKNIEDKAAEEPKEEPEEEREDKPEIKPETEPEKEAEEESDEAPAEDAEEKPAEDFEEEPAQDAEEKPAEDSDQKPGVEAEKEAADTEEEKTAPAPTGKEIKVQKKAQKKAREKAQKKAQKRVRKIADKDLEDDESEEGGMGLNLFTLFVLLLAASITIIYYTCTVKTVKVEGNHLYTSEEIAAKVISDDTQLRHNTVFLWALYKTPKAPRIPFEESVKISLESYDTIRITVKDMNIAAFIPYAGKNLYFSADGIVLENSPLLVKNATFVTGLNITGAERGEKMTADDEAGLSMVLEVLQILRKYQIRVESVVLADSGGIIIYMDDIKVLLGRSGYELKISKIAQLLPYLEGRSGTIDLTNYTSADQNIILK